MNANLRKHVFLAGLLVGLFAADTIHAGEASNRRVLRLALYPFVPQKAEMLLSLKEKFESTHTEINLQFVDLPGYYEGQLWSTLTNQPPNVDVVEVDTVFLRDLVDSHLIQELPSGTLQPSDFLPVAQKACVLDNNTYGVPHWVCGNFLFFHADDPDAARFRSVNSLAGLEKVVGRPLSWSEALLLSLNGKSTLGEEYLDAVLDIYETPSEALRHTDPKAPSQEAVKAINRLALLTPGTICASDKHHNYGQFFARSFAQRKSRVFIGYSEELNNVVDEFLHGVPDGEPSVGKIRFTWSDTLSDYAVEGDADIGAIPAPFSDHPTHMLAWVDVLALRTGLSGQSREDALEFIRFFNSEGFMLSLLVPSFGEAPRYLMPARASVFHNEKLLKAAPLYATLYEMMTNTTAVTGPNLNTNLRNIGKKLQKDGFWPQP